MIIKTTPAATKKGSRPWFRWSGAIIAIVVLAAVAMIWSQH
jgi:hypothetical protein